MKARCRPRVPRRPLIIAWFYLGAALIPLVLFAVTASGWSLGDFIITLALPLLPTLGMGCVIWLYPPIVPRARRRYEVNAFWMGLVAAIACIGVELLPGALPFGFEGTLIVFFMCGALTAAIGLRLSIRARRIAHRCGLCERCGYDLRGSALTDCPECGKTRMSEGSPRVGGE